MLRIIFVFLLSLGTMTAWIASTKGWGLPSLMKNPVSLRAGSVHSAGHRGHRYYYFSNSHRRHRGGGFRGGK